MSYKFLLGSRIFPFFMSLLFTAAVFDSRTYAGIPDVLQRPQLTGSHPAAAQSESVIAQGLREALRVGIEKTIQETGRQDGYLNNPQIKIPLPGKLGQMESLLRKAGLSWQMDQLILSMNRAAEQAAPRAKDIFLESLTQLTFQDAQKIYKGSDTAATDFFREKTSRQLREIYKPIVTKSMARYNVTRHYNDLAEHYNQRSFPASVKMPGIEDYVVQKSLDGLFLTLAQEEKAIRRDPKARVTQILRDLFKS